MSSLAVDIGIPQATSVVVTSDELTVDLVDGRTVSVPLSWHPRLVHASENERNKWRLIGYGEGVVMQFECGTRILRVIHGRDASATLSNCTTTRRRDSLARS